ncbi:hypothetical protein QYE76_038561 [Lolium multiflorum]|uniref:F-box domain-containing protein n=1 Tax=Lolium multiflorum TaxID=4521 RepID=A0AAD8T965_LOLMU|nr:F-box/LRR-repeat/kelch-repeat protein At1g09650-like [Lolium perenne]KAK1677713.1 hypothetical protein QYE76_038561 [Lolium multiflorum]
MDDDTTPETRHVPHEVVWQILLFLPVKSLIRFTCVCKTWRSTITGDESFQRSHHRLQQPCVLIAPLIKTSDGGDGRRSSITNLKVTIPGLYQWERKSHGAATLVQATDSFPAEEASHRSVHCDGLVLMPMGRTVRVLNPATRRVLTLPPCGLRNTFVPNRPSWLIQGPLGLGHDPRSNTYKVARFFYRYWDAPMESGRHYSYEMEVFTIGRDQHWRETAAPPPYPVIAGQTTTFFKGSLLWTIDESMLQKDDPHVRGFLRFNLEDESFSVTPAPPGCPKLRDMARNLAEMGGELYLAHEGPRAPDTDHPQVTRYGCVAMWTAPIHRDGFNAMPSGGHTIFI